MRGVLRSVRLRAMDEPGFAALMGRAGIHDRGDGEGADLTIRIDIEPELAVREAEALDSDSADAGWPLVEQESLKGPGQDLVIELDELASGVDFPVLAFDPSVQGVGHHCGDL